MVDDLGLFPTFEREIRALTPGGLSAGPLPESMLLARDGALEIYYAPMDSIQLAARLVIIGITPGQDTARLALGTASIALAQGQPPVTALAEAKVHAAFSGFRRQLVTWLDYLDIPRHLQLRDPYGPVAVARDERCPLPGPCERDELQRVEATAHVTSRSPPICP